MGKYIQTDSNKGKADYLIAHENAVEYPGPLTRTQEFYDKQTDCGRGIVAIVDNGPFEAAGFAFSFDEFMVFTDPAQINGRPVRYLAMARRRAEHLSGCAWYPDGGLGDDPATTESEPAA